MVAKALVAKRATAMDVAVNLACMSVLALLICVEVSYAELRCYAVSINKVSI